MGHEDQFRAGSLSDRCRIGEGTFAGAAPKDQEAPIPAVHKTAIECRTRPPKADVRLPHSVTSAARCRIDCGTVRAGALADFRLVTSWKLLGCSTERSGRFAPLQILSPYGEALLNKS